jgi:hypothetical protein
MTHLLDDHFVQDLLSGSLSNLLEYVIEDPSLDLQIRDNYINIYFRGGNILKVNKKDVSYEFFFDKNYFKGNKLNSKDALFELLNKSLWNDYFPEAKQVMNRFFGATGNEEREFQQLVVRDNNRSSLANGTDFFIIDVEYDYPKIGIFDMVAVEWLSEGPKRKCPEKYKPKLYIIEMKYGDKALKGKSGLRDHQNQFHHLIGNEAYLEQFKQEMVNLFDQKRNLGLIPCISKTNNPNLVTMFDDNIEFAFLLANHDPAKKSLFEELEILESDDVSFIVSNFMGYGIFQEAVHKYDDFRRLYKQQIHINEV